MADAKNIGKIDVHTGKKPAKPIVVFGLTVVILAQMALPAFAGVTSVNHGAVGTPLTVASELGSFRTVGIMPPAGTDGIRYQQGLPLTVSNLIEITLVGATFKAGTVYNICDGAIQVASATPGAVSQYILMLNADPGGGGLNPLNLTNAPCAAADQAVDVTLNAPSAVSTATVKFRSLTSGGIQLDETLPANLAVIAPKYSIQIGNSSHTIDVVSAGADGTQFTTATGANANGVLGGVPTVLADSGQGSGAVAPSLRITVTAKNVDEITNTNGNAVPGLTTGANVIVTGDFTGVSKTFIADGAATCDSMVTAPAPGNRVQSTSTTSPVILSIPSAQFSQATGAGNVDFRLCVLVNGTTVLNPRILQASIDINVVGLGANDPAATAAQNAMSWTRPNRPPDGIIDSPSGNVTVIAGNSVNFQGIGSDPDNNLPLSFLWTFGGGAPDSTLQNPGFVTFDSPGVFTVSLTVTDSSGLSDATPATRIITVVADNLGPSVVITSHTNNQTVNSSPITVSGTASDAGRGDNGISSVTVNAVAANNGTASGAGTANWDQSVALIPGPNAITVVAKDNSPNQNSSTVEITVNLNQAPNGTITSPANNITIAAGGSVNFQGSGTDPENHLPLSFSWNFDGGAPDSTLPNPGLVTFNSQGTFNVTLTVADNLGLADSTPAARTIRVIPPPAVVFVEPLGSCNGNDPCFTTIQEAIGVVALGGTIRVAQATYPENIIIATSKNFTLEGGWSSSFASRSNDPALTTLDGDLTGDGVGEGRVFELSASTGVDITVTIDRFTIQNGNGDHGGGVFASPSNGGSIDLTLTGNIIRNNQATNSGAGVGVFAEDAGSSAQATLTNNMIHANDAGGDGGGVFAYADLSGELTITLTNNTITDNTAVGVGGGLRAYAGNASVGQVTVLNSIMWGNAASSGHDIAIRQSPGSTATVDASFSDIGDVSADADAPGNYNDLGNNLDGDPLFVNFPASDLHLGSGSPALDVGTSTGAPTVDFEGTTRPQGPAHDIGADERIAGPLSIGATSPLPQGEIGVSYDTSLLVSGGIGPYIIEVSKGNLPNGLSLVGQNISGIPTATGKPFTIKVTDQSSTSISRKFTLPLLKAVAVATSRLPTGRVGRSYTATLKAANGKSPFAWLIIAGTLPAGLIFDATTGVISGTPTVAVKTTLAFQVTDDMGGKAQKTLKLTVK